MPACTYYSALVMEARASSMLDKGSSKVLHPDPEHPLRLAEGFLLQNNRNLNSLLCLSVWCLFILIQGFALYLNRLA